MCVEFANIAPEHLSSKFCTTGHSNTADETSQSVEIFLSQVPLASILHALAGRTSRYKVANFGGKQTDPPLL